MSAAHAVVLASGTLAPVSSLQQQLFPGLPQQQLCHFSCGHVVSKGHSISRAPKCAASKNIDRLQK